MGRKAILTFASNANISKYVGQQCELEKNASGGYQFTFDNGDIVNTSSAKYNSVLGDINSPFCKNLGFETNSGSMYSFNLMEMEQQLGRRARLLHCSNPKLNELIGQSGILSKNDRGGYQFMLDSGQVINTTALQEGTVIGDVDIPICRNVGFETASGSRYSFELTDIEKIADGVRRDGNRLVGFEDKKNRFVGDRVYDPNGYRGHIAEADYKSQKYYVRHDDINLQHLDGWYNTAELKSVETNLAHTLEFAKTRANDYNNNHVPNAQKVVEDLEFLDKY